MYRRILVVQFLNNPLGCPFWGKPPHGSSIWKIYDPAKLKVMGQFSQGLRIKEYCLSSTIYKLNESGIELKAHQTINIDSENNCYSQRLADRHPHFGSYRGICAQRTPVHKGKTSSEPPQANQVKPANRKQLNYTFACYSTSSTRLINVGSLMTPG